MKTDTTQANTRQGQTEMAIEKENQLETARSINRQADALLKSELSKPSAKDTRSDYERLCDAVYHLERLQIEFMLVKSERDELLAACRLAAERIRGLEIEHAKELGWSPALKACEAAIARSERNARR